MSASQHVATVPVDGLVDASGAEAPSSSVARPSKVAPGGWTALGLLSFIYMLNFMDRQLLSILIEPIKRDIAITDTEIGLLTGTIFAIVYSVITVPVAMLADRTSRVRIVAAGCFLWSLFAGVTGFATSMLHLAITRIGLAFGEAGGVAPSLSLLSDYFPPDRRVIAVSLFTSAGPLGAIVGTTGGGLLAMYFGWRATFQLAGVIGLVMVPILLLLVREPLRGRFERQRPAPPKSFGFTVSLYRDLPSLRWLALSAGLFAVVANGLFTWMPALLMRTYRVAIGDVALYYGPVVGVALIAGNWMSGVLVERLGRRSLRYYTWVPAVAILLCAPTLAFALALDSWQWTIVCLFVPIALCNFGIAPTLTLVQNLTPPEVRSAASALLLLVLGLVGIGLGPLIVGAASDLLRVAHGADSLRLALLVGLIPAMVLCGFTFFMAGRHVMADQTMATGSGAAHPETAHPEIGSDEPSLGSGDQSPMKT